PDQHRPRVAEEDDVLRVVVAVVRDLCSTLRGGGHVVLPVGGKEGSQCDGQDEHAPGDPGSPARTSLIGLAPRAAMVRGRPTLDGFCLPGSMPRAAQTVAMKLGTDTGFSSTLMPSALVRP